MPKVSISEAARRLETTEEVIREWIRLGLLDVEPLPLERRRAKENFLAFYVRGVAPEPRVDLEQLYRVDLEQLYEVAEREGWSLLSLEAWDAADSEP
jgi:hypothetical protein